jgi:hypothetical protein
MWRADFHDASYIILGDWIVDHQIFAFVARRPKAIAKTSET